MAKIKHEVKLEIIDLHKSGARIKSILKFLSAKGHNVPRHVIAYWIKQFEAGYFNPDEVCVKKPSVCAKLCQRDVEIVKKSLSLNVNQSSRDIHRQLKDDGADFSLQTTKNLIVASGYTSDQPRYAQMVRGPNTEPRLNFCKALVSANDNMNDIIFTDESSIQLHNNKTTCYRLKDRRNHTIPKPKHPLKVHVWAGISRRGPTKLCIFDGIMESTFFTNSVLKGTLLPFIRAVYPDGHRFQQDNDPKHKSKLSQKFMRENGINWWDVWPSESPDLNPIEMVWNQLKRSVAKVEPRTKQELVDAIKDFWYGTMTADLCNRYINHIYKVAPVCIEMNGKATGDVPNNLFKDRSEGLSFSYFSDLLTTEECRQKMKELNIGPGVDYMPIE